MLGFLHYLFFSDPCFGYGQVNSGVNTGKKGECLGPTSSKNRKAIAVIWWY